MTESRQVRRARERKGSTCSQEVSVSQPSSPSHQWHEPSDGRKVSPLAGLALIAALGGY
jgi:hypothetical protein